MNNKVPSSLYLNILSLYLVLSVVNWLPIISPDAIRAVKYILFIYIFAYEINNYNFKFPSIFLSPIGLIFIFMSMSFGIFLSPNINAIVDIALPFIIIWIFNFDKDYYYGAIYRSSLIIAFICLLSTISNLTGFLNIEPNGPWSSSFWSSCLWRI